MNLRHERLNTLAALPPPQMHILANRPLRDIRGILVTQPLPDPLRGMTLLPRRAWSASSHPSITARYAPSFGAGRPTGARFTGGTGDTSAALTARR